MGVEPGFEPRQLDSEEEQKFQNVSLWHISYFKLVIFKKLQAQEKLWKQKLAFLRDSHMYKENMHL